MRGHGSVGLDASTLRNPGLKCVTHVRSAKGAAEWRLAITSRRCWRALSPWASSALSANTGGVRRRALADEWLAWGAVARGEQVSLRPRGGVNLGQEQARARESLPTLRSGDPRSAMPRVRGEPDRAPRACGNACSARGPPKRSAKAGLGPFDPAGTRGRGWAWAAVQSRPRRRARPGAETRAACPARRRGCPPDLKVPVRRREPPLACSSPPASEFRRCARTATPAPQRARGTRCSAQWCSRG